MISVTASLSSRRVSQALGRTGAWLRFRFVLAASLVVSATVMFSLFSPAYRALQTEGYRTATFDLWLNGPLDAGAAQRVEAIQPGAKYALVADVTPRYLELNGRRSTVGAGRWVEDPEQFAMLYPVELLVAGAQPTSLGRGDVVIDSVTADSLGASVGDSITGNFGTVDGTFYDVPFRVTGIVLATSHLRSSMAGVLNDGVRRAVASDTPLFSSLFVAGADDEAFAASLPAVDPDLQVFRRTDLLNDAIATANQLANPFRERAFLVIALAILVVFILRDLRAMLAQRSRAAAVLIALGLRPGTIARAIIIEQILLLTGALAVGLALGTAAFTWVFRIAVPVDAWVVVATSMAALLVASTITVVVFVTRNLGRVPVNRLLFEGS